MDNKKILLVNLSKGKTGELNSQLLGMIFVMKFQAAAMGRADIPESERVDFALYVDEFQNFATDSFESILSEDRKYRLSLVLANQFMTQLTDKIREAIIGNIGTVISGRIGITDAEILVKKFSPTFDAEDLTRLPNFKSITTVMINNVPSAPFSMTLLPPMGQSNPQLRDALKKLSAAKYGVPRAEAERSIFARLGAGDAAKKAKMDQLKQAQQDRMATLQRTQGQALQGGPRPAGMPGAAPSTGAPSAGGSSFLDEWLAKRQQISSVTPAPAAGSTPSSNPTPAFNQAPPVVNTNPAFGPTIPTAPNPFLAPPQQPRPVTPTPKPQAVSQPVQRPQQAPAAPVKPAPQPAKPVQAVKPPVQLNKLHIRDTDQNSGDEVHIKLR